MAHLHFLVFKVITLRLVLSYIIPTLYSISNKIPFNKTLDLKIKEVDISALLPEKKSYICLKHIGFEYCTI